MATGDLSKVNVNPAQLGNTAAVIYAIPTGYKTIHIELNLCNTDPTTEYLPDVYMIPSGSSAGVTNQVVKGVASVTGLSPGQSRIYTWDQFLPQGSLISGKADTASKITHKLSLVLEAT